MTLTTLTLEEELVEAARQVVRLEREDDAMCRDDAGGEAILTWTWDDVPYFAAVDWLRECLRAYEAGPE